MVEWIFCIPSVANLISIYLYLSTVLDPLTILFREVYNMHKNFVKRSKVFKKSRSKIFRYVLSRVYCYFSIYLLVYSNYTREIYSIHILLVNPRLYVVFTATTFLLHVPTYFTILKVSGLAKKKHLMEVFTYFLSHLSS